MCSKKDCGSVSPNTPDVSTILLIVLLELLTVCGSTTEPERPISPLGRVNVFHVGSPPSDFTTPVSSGTVRVGSLGLWVKLIGAQLGSALRSFSWGGRPLTGLDPLICG